MIDPSKPLINISVPGPYFLLDNFSLVLIYATAVLADYYICCRTSIPYQKYKKYHVLFHILLPFLFGPKDNIFSTPFITFPWFVASVGTYASQKYKYQQSKNDVSGPPQSLLSWLKSIGVEGFLQKLDRQPNGTTLTNNQVRIEGVKRLIQTATVMILGNEFITPLLLEDPNTLFTLRWYTTQSIYYGFLMGLKGYTLMVFSDIISSICQIVTGYRTLEVFNKPFLASSPKDFWGNRWNLMVRHLLRKQLYVGIKSNDKGSSIALKRWHAFFISALMHEAIMALVNRHITMEQFSFFMIQGFAVYLQSVIPVPKRIVDNTPRIFSTVMTLFFISLTGKLFLNPFLRYDEQAVLLGRQSFI